MRMLMELTVRCHQKAFLLDRFAQQAHGMRWADQHRKWKNGEDYLGGSRLIKVSEPEQKETVWEFQEAAAG